MENTYKCSNKSSWAVSSIVHCAEDNVISIIMKLKEKMRLFINAQADISCKDSEEIKLLEITRLYSFHAMKSEKMMKLFIKEVI